MKPNQCRWEAQTEHDEQSLSKFNQSLATFLHLCVHCAKNWFFKMPGIIGGPVLRIKLSKSLRLFGGVDKNFFDNLKIV